MFYTQTNQRNSTSMPLLMNFTKPEKIQEMENEEPIIYDPVSQTVFEMRTVGTKSLRRPVTKKKNPHGSGFIQSQDPKNEIDDSKTVK
ncbi:MAG: hypothetical protein LBE36_11340 [Flavobacteriaceae bacterium]|jgi:hypothetical protein|nr:hypothetical protein [Flavobacteriaceae bacterium]